MENDKKKKFTIRFEPSGLKTEVPAGMVLLEAAHKVGIYLSSICGGDGYCGKCKVIIDQGQFQSTGGTAGEYCFSLSNRYPFRYDGNGSKVPCS